MSYTEQEHEAVLVSDWYVIATDTDECLVGTRVWFGLQCGHSGLIEIDCLAVKESDA